MRSQLRADSSTEELCVQVQTQRQAPDRRRARARPAVYGRIVREMCEKHSRNTTNGHKRNRPEVLNWFGLIGGNWSHSRGLFPS